MSQQQQINMNVALKDTTPIKCDECENEVFIDAEDLPAGTYIIKLVSGKQNQSVKFMKL